MKTPKGLTLFCAIEVEDTATLSIRAAEGEGDVAEVSLLSHSQEVFLTPAQLDKLAARCTEAAEWLRKQKTAPTKRKYWEDT